MRTKQWFYNRIGKRIYRGKTSCKCATCKDVKNDGLIILDTFHADYLYMVQGELKIDYKDKK
jgi:hypothetical protein